MSALANYDKALYQAYGRLLLVLHQLCNRLVKVTKVIQTKNSLEVLQQVLILPIKFGSCQKRLHGKSIIGPVAAKHGPYMHCHELTKKEVNEIRVRMNLVTVNHVSWPCA